MIAVMTDIGIEFVLKSLNTYRGGCTFVHGNLLYSYTAAVHKFLISVPVLRIIVPTISIASMHRNFRHTHY